MSNKSDKSLVLKIIAACTIAILVFTFAWAKHFFYNLDHWLFSLVYGGLIVLFVIEAKGAYKHADDPNKEWKRWILVLVAVALCAWAGGWAAGNNEKKMFNQDVEKAKQSQIINIKPFNWGIPPVNRNISFVRENLYPYKKPVIYLEYHGTRCIFNAGTINNGDNAKFLSYILRNAEQEGASVFKNCQFKVEFFMVKDGIAGSFRIYDFQVKGEVA